VPAAAITRNPARAFCAAAIFLIAIGIGAFALAGAEPCVGDCNENDNVSTPELSLIVSIGLGEVSLGACPAADPNDDSAATVEEMVRAVNEHLDECHFVTPTLKPTPVPPDLVLDDVIYIVPTPPSGCIDSTSSLGTHLEICVRNQGGDAPPFAVDVNLMRFGFPGLLAAERQCMSVPFAAAPGQTTIRVDPDDVIAETDETNNDGTFSFPVLTPPITCTATATQTAPPTETPLPEGTPSQTRTPTVTPCACTPTGTKTQNPVSTNTPTASPTPTATPRLPDLIPNRVILVAPTPIGGCIHNLGEIDVALLVCALNDSNGAAGPFQASLSVAASVFVEFPQGVAADSERCEQAPFFDGQFVFTVDTAHQIAESNEANNQAVFSIPRPTQPPFCPTPTATPQ